MTELHTVELDKVFICECTACRWEGECTARPASRGTEYDYCQKQGFENDILSDDAYPRDLAIYLCEVCDKTLAGNRARHPNHPNHGVDDHSVIQLVAQCTNLILSRINEVSRPRS